MKNYLKKAISAVIALALAASIVPASFAANVVLTDVPETADYATAVNTLVALGIVNGYDDNTFLPDNNITRAEASKIVVAALNETASADAMKGATKFSDIEAKHEWATGYINKGVSMGYINGMENNTFQPDGNVTYAQIIKMMLCAMGYEDYAASLADQYGYTGANWYIPFTQLAADAGVTDGVYANPNEAVTRAQVAQLVYNAIKAPMVKNIGIRYTESGKIVPNIQIQDGIETSVYYRSILTEKFDAYYVEGYVTATQKDTTSLKADEVKFGVAKSKKYVEEAVRYTSTVDKYSDFGSLTARDKENNLVSSRILQKVNVGDTAAADYLAVYATAIVMLDENDDWKLLDFTPSGKNKTYTFDLKDLDDEDFRNTSDVLTYSEWSKIKTGTAPYLKFFVDGANASTKYLLDAAANVKVYVNGVEVTNANTAAADPIWNYVINGDVGEVTLVDTYKTDGKIDAINVNTYATGILDSVSSTGKLTFKDDDAGVGSFTLDEDDASVEFKIYYNGEEITINDLKEDDVLSIVYDVKAGTNAKLALRNSKFFEIYVSRDVVTDTLRGKDDEDFEAKFGDTYYPFISSSKYDSFDKNSKLGDEYTLYLDAFGRVFKAEINSSAANWGIAEKFALNTGAGDDDYKLTIFTADGSTKAYYFDDSKATVTKANGTEMNKDYKDVANTTSYGSGETLNSLVEQIVYSNVSTRAKNAINTRVIQYKVSSSSGMITELKFIGSNSDTLAGTLGREDFKVRNNTIGSIKMGEATKIVDATKYTVADPDLSATTVAGLTDEVAYKAYAYGDKIDGIYPFVLVTEGEAAYNAKSRFAVVTEEGFAEEEDEETGDTIYSIKAMYGDKTELIVSGDVSTSILSGLKKGDVIYFKSDAKGYVTDIDKIFAFGSSVPTQAALATATIAVNNTDSEPDYTTDALTDYTMPYVQTVSGNSDFSSDFTKDWTKNDTDAIKLVYGAVVERTDSDVTFAKIGAYNGTITFAGPDGIINSTETPSSDDITYSGNKTTNLLGGKNDVNGVVTFDIAKDVNVYTYDYSANKDYRFGFSGKSTSAIAVSKFATKNMYNDNVIVWDMITDFGSDNAVGGATGTAAADATDNMSNVSTAFAVVVKGEIVDIISFIAE